MKKIIIFYNLLLVLCLSSVYAQAVSKQSLLGTWLMDESAVDYLMTKMREEAKDSNDQSMINLIEPMLRRLAGKRVVEFTETKMRNINGARVSTSNYTIESIEDNVLGLIIKGKKFNAEIEDNVLIIRDEKNKGVTAFRKLSEDELKVFKDKIEAAKRGPSSDAQAIQRMMWVINADPENGREYIERNPDLIQLRAERNRTFLHVAVQFKKLHLVKLLLTKGADINALDKYNATPFHYAIRFGFNKELLDILIEAGADIDRKDNIKRTPIEKAIRDDNYKLAEYLLGKGAAVNGNVVKGGKTPFLYCVETSKIEMAQLLLKHGADLNATFSSYKDGALYLAARYGTIEMIQFLLGKGADPNKPNNEGWLPITNTKFRKSDKLAAIKLLVESGADVNAKGASGSLIIHAVKEQDIELVKGLIALGADVNAKAIFGKTAIEIAEELNNQALISMLKSVE